MAGWTDVATAVFGGAGILGAVGAPIKLLWSRVEQRFVRIEQQLEECRKREVESHARRGIQLTVIELLWMKVKETDPGAAVLERAKKLLDDLKERSGSNPG